MLFKVFFFVSNAACVIQTIGQAHGVWKPNSWFLDIWWGTVFLISVAFLFLGVITLLKIKVDACVGHDVSCYPAEHVPNHHIHRARGQFMDGRPGGIGLLGAGLQTFGGHDEMYRASD